MTAEILLRKFKRAGAVELTTIDGDLVVAYATVKHGGYTFVQQRFSRSDDWEVIHELPENEQKYNHLHELANGYFMDKNEDSYKLTDQMLPSYTAERVIKENPELVSGYKSGNSEAWESLVRRTRYGHDDCLDIKAAIGELEKMLQAA